jgi:hypothetical protein
LKPWPVKINTKATSFSIVFANTSWQRKHKVLLSKHLEREDTGAQLWVKVKTGKFLQAEWAWAMTDVSLAEHEKVFFPLRRAFGGVDSWQRIKGGGSGQVAVRIGAAGAP